MPQNFSSGWLFSCFTLLRDTLPTQKCLQETGIWPAWSHRAQKLRKIGTWPRRPPRKTGDPMQRKTMPNHLGCSLVLKMPWGGVSVLAATWQYVLFFYFLWNNLWCCYNKDCWVFSCLLSALQYIPMFWLKAGLNYCCFKKAYFQEKEQLLLLSCIFWEAFSAI